MKILNVRIDNITKQQALGKVREFLNSQNQHTIFTPNPEMLVEAHKDKAFRDILNSGSLNICDGKGIELFSKEKIERIPGTDFMRSICKLAAEQGKSIYLLGGPGSIEKTKEELQKLFPHLTIVGSHSGPQIIKAPQYQFAPGQSGINTKVIADIQQKNPDIFFVAFGHGKQEWWISSFLKEFPSVRIAMGVGGAFDYIAGSARRAPKWFRNMGLEWVFRLITQPKRFKRIFNAVIIFPYLVLKERYVTK